MHTHYGFIFIGGGLSSILAAYAWLKQGYSKPLLIIEQSKQLCGNHTWSFNQTDILPEAWHTLQPLTDASWARYEVKFPKVNRTLNITYHSITSESLASKIQKLCLENPLLNIITAQKATVVQRGNTHLNPVVETENGQEYTADWVIQATGVSENNTDTAYQKFLGLEVLLETSSNTEYPLIMDATVPQKDGFRFMYVLPFEPKRLLIEDTYYSLNPNLDILHLTKEIQGYAQRKGWKIKEIIRQEQGVLPIPLQQNTPKALNDKILPLGMRADLFHVTTGYSLAVNFNFVWQMYSYLNQKDLNTIWYKKQQNFYKSMRFYRIMNRFLFIAGKTNKRYRFLETFYQRQNESAVARFYAGNSSFKDKMSIFSGKAPFLPSWYMLNTLAGKRQEV
jgi:lycopene beta-cyclase